MFEVVKQVTIIDSELIDLPGYPKFYFGRMEGNEIFVAYRTEKPKTFMYTGLDKDSLLARTKRILDGIEVSNAGKTPLTQ